MFLSQNELGTIVPLSPLDLMIIGKYFNDIYDFINLIKTCKNINQLK